MTQFMQRIRSPWNSKTFSGSRNLAVLILAVLVAACEPNAQTPGQWLRGDIVETFPRDWTFTDEVGEIFVQVGAFGERSNAAGRLAVLSQSGIHRAFIHEDTTSRPTLYRVRVGPVAGVDQYDQLVEKLKSLGIKDPYLISE